MILHRNHTLFDLNTMFYQFGNEFFVRIAGCNFAVYIVSLVFQGHICRVAMKDANNLSLSFQFLESVRQEVHVVYTYRKITSKCQMIHVKYDICLFQHYWNIDNDL